MLSEAGTVGAVVGVLIVPWISIMARPEGVCRIGGSGFVRSIDWVPLVFEAGACAGGGGGWRVIDGMVEDGLWCTEL